MSEFKINAFMADIKIKTGIDIRISSRKRENFYSRVVFFKIIKEKNPKLQLVKMGETVGLHHTAVIYSLKSYEHLKSYSDFNKIENEIRSIDFDYNTTSKLYCNPISYYNE
jgi:hypothetical protein